MGSFHSDIRFVSPMTKTLYPRAEGEVFIGLQISTPTNPPAGYNALYFKPDGNLYRLTSAGVETKFTLSGGIVNDDISASAAIALSKIASHRAHVFRAAANYNSLGSGGYTSIQFDDEYFDTESIHSTVSNTSRLTCVTAGVYLIWGQANAPSGGTTKGIRIYLNGTTTIGRSVLSTAGGFGAPVVAVRNLAVSNYVELQIFHDVGSSQTPATESDHPQFGMFRIS